MNTNNLRAKGRRELAEKESGAVARECRKIGIVLQTSNGGQHWTFRGAVEADYWPGTRRLNVGGSKAGKRVFRSVEGLQSALELILGKMPKPESLPPPELKVTKRKVPSCPKCGKLAKFYSKGNPAWSYKFGAAFGCEPCDEWVGCDKDGKPNGSMANAELRRARQRARKLYGALCQHNIEALGFHRKKARHVAYDWLSKTLNIPRNDCYIARLGIADCERVAEACRPYFSVLSGAKPKQKHRQTDRLAKFYDSPATYSQKLPGMGPTVTSDESELF